jgi:aldehyde:ferredoxin oxidoreductase
MGEALFDRYLEIDLGKRTFQAEKIDREILRKFVGGKGVGLALLTRMDKSKDPLDPENPLIFATGPLTGTIIQTSARSVVVTRSPLTGNFLDSNAGGHFGPALRRAGWDYVSVLGAAEEPVYLVITPSEVQFKDASDLWGKDIFETERILKEQHPQSRVAAIGPAGENLVRFACIGTELYRQFGRGGSGAVMGSKKLKAVVVQGNQRVEYADEKEFKKLAREIVEELKVHPNAKRRYELGTMMWVRMGQEIGHFLPTRNYQKGQFEHYEKITAETMKKELGWESVGCFGCAIIRCAKFARWNGFELEGPEYETTAFLGSGCCLADAKDVAYANWLCDRYGLDTISSGVTISFAMECAEKGLLSAQDNARIKFGSAQAVHSLIEEISFKRGIGEILAEGTRRASKIIGKGSEYFAINIGGMEISGVNILGCYSMGLNLATADFGSHTRFWSATDEMNGALTLKDLPSYVKKGQDEINVRNSMVICDFFPFGLERLAPLMRAATGFDYSPEELLEIGERIHSLSRLYNLKTGRTHADDTLPPRFFEEESFAGLMKGKKIPREYFEKQVQEIFALRGWDSEGRPKPETLRRLGVD